MSRAEQRDARKLMKHLEIAYTHALRLLREGRYHLRDLMAYDALGDLDWLPLKPPKKLIFIQRLTLTCSHIKLWGPFTDMSNEKMIGDHTSCDVCPGTGKHGLKQFHLVVKAETVDERDCSPAWIQTGLL